jgi:hypothetical protein
MPGRNDPCPCGSGKKYKKCCLEKDRARAAPPPPPTVEHRPAPPPPPPPPSKSEASKPPPDPRREALDKFWKEFESRDCEGRVATFLDVLDDEELMAPGSAFEMLLNIHGELMKRGEWERFRDLVETLRQRRPEVYEESAPTYLSWILHGALAAGQFDAIRPVALELGRRAGQDIDYFNRTFDHIAYEGHLDTLLEMLRLGWPEVKESANVVPWGIAEFAEKGARYEIYHYLEHTADPRGDDPELLERIGFYVDDLDTGYIALMVDTLAGRNDRSWSVADFEMGSRRKRKSPDEDEDEDERPHDPAVDNLGQLTLEFLRYLRHEEGVSYPKGDLAREELLDYFPRRHEGKLQPRGSMYEEVVLHKKPPRAPKPEHPLCPDRVTMDVHLGGLIGFFNGLYYRAAATFEAIPAWLRFLQTRGLIDAERRRRTVEQLMPLQANLLEGWGHSAEFADLHRAAQAWPEDAARDPEGE